MGGPCDFWTQTRARPWRAESVCACTQQTVRPPVWPGAPTASCSQTWSFALSHSPFASGDNGVGLGQKANHFSPCVLFPVPTRLPQDCAAGQRASLCVLVVPFQPNGAGGRGKAGRHMCRPGSQGPGLDVSPASEQSIYHRVCVGHPCRHPVVFCGSFRRCPGLPCLPSPPLRVHPDQKPSPHSCSPEREQPPICPSLHGSVWLCTPWGACPCIQLVPGSSVPPEPRGLW